jgi:hypothetical protein
LVLHYSPSYLTLFDIGVGARLDQFVIEGRDNILPRLIERRNAIVPFGEHTNRIIELRLARPSSELAFSSVSPPPSSIVSTVFLGNMKLNRVLSKSKTVQFAVGVELTDENLHFILRHASKGASRENGRGAKRAEHHENIAPTRCPADVEVGVDEIGDDLAAATMKVERRPRLESWCDHPPEAVVPWPQPRRAPRFDARPTLPSSRT